MTIRFTDFIQIKDAASFKDAFEESVSKKVFEALEAKKIEVAQGFFGESHKGMCPECDKPMTKCSCEESVQESASSERKGDASANGYRAHSIQVADAAASAAADHHKMLFQSHISKHAEATGAGDSQAAHHHMEKAKMHASVHYEMTGKHVYEETNTGFGDHYPTEKNPKARIKGSLPGTKDYPTAPNAGFKGKVPSSGMKIHDKTNEEVEQINEGKAPSDIENKLRKLHGGFGKIKQKGKNTFTHTSEGENEDGDPAKITHTYILNKKGKLVHIGTQSVVEEVEQIDELSLDTLYNAAAEAEHERDYGDPQKRKKFRRQAKFFNRAANAATDHYEKKLIIRDRKGNPIGYRNNAKPVSYPREEVGLDEGMHKHEKKHGKMHHKLAKKMMKLAHKHAKKHHHEEEEE